MNTIIHDNYPVARLPKDLREQVAGSRAVRLTIEPLDADVDVLALEELFAENARLRASGKIKSRSQVEIAARIRELRDVWDD